MSDLAALRAAGTQFELEHAVHIIIECCKLAPTSAVAANRIQISDEGRISLEGDAAAVDPTDVVLSLGTVLWELLANRELPKDERVPPLPHVPASLEAIVRTALAKDPEQRYETPKHLAAALAAYMLSLN